MPPLKEKSRPSKLTPIKIRGKGPRKKGWKPPPPRPSRTSDRANSTDTTTTTTRKRSRSSTEEPDGTSASSDRRRKRRREKLELKKASGAPIERLPKEILEIILLYSQNVNFAKASWRIGCVLSGQSTLMRVVLSAFAPTWDVWFGVVPGEVQGYSGWQENGERIGGDAGFQSEVLECSWVSVDLILNAQRFWFRQDQRERRRRGEGNLHCGWLEVCSPGTSGFDATEDDIQKCFEREWDRYMKLADDILTEGRKSLSLSDGFDHLISKWIDLTASSSLDMHINTGIPDYLIRDPLRDPENRLKLLCWLVRQGANLPVGQTWELGKLGYEKLMEHASHQHSLVALVLFSRLGVFSRWPTHVLRDKVQEATDMCYNAQAANKDSSCWALAEFLLDRAYVGEEHL